LPTEANEFKRIRWARSIGAFAHDGNFESFPFSLRVTTFIGHQASDTEPPQNGRTGLQTG
jgi:hypothetical protein